MLVIGVDCATKANKTGMVIASWLRDALRLEEATLGATTKPCPDVLTEWIDGGSNVLLALDAPLGWPRSLAIALREHSAGDVLLEEPDQLFSRATDHRVRERLGKRPFEVGANFIARTAHAALALLHQLRQQTGHPIPLVWDPTTFQGVGAIEVYPAATRIARGVSGDTMRLNGLAECMSGDLSKLGRNPHVLDAAWCAVAGADYLAGRAAGPTPSDLDTAKREGWIWVCDHDSCQ